MSLNESAVSTTGWYPDPFQPGQLRYWDGADWGPSATPPFPKTDGKVWAVMAQVSTPVLPVIGPVLVRQLVGKTDEFAKHCATEALNFHITFLVWWNASIIAMVAFASTATNGSTPGWLPVAFLAVFVSYFLMLANIVYAAVRVSQARWYKYPISIRVIPGARKRSEIRLPSGALADQHA